MADQASSPKRISDQGRPQFAGTSGIYEIVNLVDGRRYIGSAVDLAQRWHHHRSRLARGRHHNRRLQSAWDKYGPDAFAFHVLQTCGRDDLIALEQRSFDLFSPEYNLCRIAGSTLGISLTNETRQKISVKARGRPRSAEAIEASASKLRGRPLPPERIKHLIGNRHAVGLTHTDEWKAANSKRNTGVKRPKSPEQRARISAALKGNSHSPERRAAQAAGQLGKKRGPYKLDPSKHEQRVEHARAMRAGQKGQPRSPETVEKMRASLTGRRLSPDHRAAIGAGAKAAWAKRKAATRQD